jgi:hypothetical protein
MNVKENTLEKNKTLESLSKGLAIVLSVCLFLSSILYYM